MKRELPDELISAYLDGELTAPQQAEVESALAESAELRQTFDELRALRDDLQHLPRYQLDEGFAARVLSRAERTMLAAPAAGGDASSPGSPSIIPMKEATELFEQQSRSLRRWRRAFWCASSMAALFLAALIVPMPGFSARGWLPPVAHAPVAVKFDDAVASSAASTSQWIDSPAPMSGQSNAAEDSAAPGLRTDDASASNLDASERTRTYAAPGGTAGFGAVGGGGGLGGGLGGLGGMGPMPAPGGAAGRGSAGRLGGRVVAGGALAESSEGMYRAGAATDGSDRSTYLPKAQQDKRALAHSEKMASPNGVALPAPPLARDQKEIEAAKMEGRSSPAAGADPALQTTAELRTLSRFKEAGTAPKMTAGLEEGLKFGIAPTPGSPEPQDAEAAQAVHGPTTVGTNRLVVLQVDVSSQAKNSDEVLKALSDNNFNIMYEKERSVEETMQDILPETVEAKKTVAAKNQLFFLQTTRNRFDELVEVVGKANPEGSCRVSEVNVEPALLAESTGIAGLGTTADDSERAPSDGTDVERSGAPATQRLSDHSKDTAAASPRAVASPDTRLGKSKQSAKTTRMAYDKGSNSVDNVMEEVKPESARLSLDGDYVLPLQQIEVTKNSEANGNRGASGQDRLRGVTQNYSFSGLQRRNVSAGSFSAARRKLSGDAGDDEGPRQVQPHSGDPAKATNQPAPDTKAANSPFGSKLPAETKPRTVPGDVESGEEVFQVLLVVQGIASPPTSTAEATTSPGTRPAPAKPASPPK